MATFAPTGDNVKTAFRAAFGLLAVAWLSRGVMHQFYPDGKVNQVLWVAALIGLGVGGLWRLYAATVAAQNAGYIQKWTDHKNFAYIFMGLSAGYTVLIFLAYYEHISVPGYLLMVMHQSTFCLLLCIVAALSEEVKWALACLASYGVATYVRINEPEPFRSSHKFNDTALMNCAIMLYLTASFGLIMALYSRQTMFSRIENKTETMMDNLSAGKSGRRCCSCSFK